MEVYNEMMEAENLKIEISVRKNVSEVYKEYWVHCTARNHEGRILWEAPLVDQGRSLKTYHDVDDALHETRNLFALPDEDHEFEGLANKEIDKTLYYLSLF